MVVFIGAIVYVPFLHFAEQKKNVVYYRIPTPVINNQPTFIDDPLDGEGVNLDEEKVSEDLLIKVGEPLITKDLRLGDVDPEVKKLQEYLNAKGFLVAESGPGSLGNETERFGRGTEDALIRFQEAHKDILLAPFGLEKGTGIVGELTRKYINS